MNRYLTIDEMIDFLSNLSENAVQTFIGDSEDGVKTIKQYVIATDARHDILNMNPGDYLKIYGNIWFFKNCREFYLE